MTTISFSSCGVRIVGVPAPILGWRSFTWSKKVDQETLNFLAATESFFLLLQLPPSPLRVFRGSFSLVRLYHINTSSQQQSHDPRSHSQSQTSI